MSLTEIDLSKNAKDATLTPAKISTNAADNFVFPNDVTADGKLHSNTLVSLTGSLSLLPLTNSATAIAFKNAAQSLSILNIDTTNNRVGINNVAPTVDLDVTGVTKISTQLNVPLIDDLSGNVAVDVTNRLLKDASNVAALDFLNRLLKASDGSTSINFNTPGTVGVDTVLDMNGNSVIHVATPVNASDAATKSYVDTVAQGLTIKTACEAATTVNLSVTAAGSQVGKTLTATSNGALVVDGYTANLNDRILVKDQTNAVDNGIYTTTQTGDVSNPFILTRATDFDNSTTVSSGDFTFINNGTVNASSGWVLSTPNPITVDTTPLMFTQFSGAGEIIAGNGLTKTGNQLDVHPSDTSLSVHIGDINVARDPAGAVGLTASGLQVNTDGTYIGISGNNVTLLNPTQHTVAGTNGELQYNNSGAFAGTPNITTDGTNLSFNLAASGPVVIQTTNVNAKFELASQRTIFMSAPGVSLVQAGIAALSLSTGSYLLSDDASQPAVSWDTTSGRKLYASSGNASMDWDGRFLITNAAAPVVQFNDGNLWLKDEATTSALSWDLSNGRNLYDTAGNTSIDWGNRVLEDETGHAAAQWTASSRILIDEAAGLAARWSSGANGGRWLYDDSGAEPAMSWDTTNGRFLYNHSGNKVLQFDTSNLLLIDGASTNALSWDTTNGRKLYDIAGLTSEDWNARNLLGDDGTTVQLNWSTSGTVQLTSATLDMNSHQIHNVTDPTAAQDAATKNYVDTHPTTPAGSNGDLQYNNSGAFGGATITSDGTNLFVPDGQYIKFGSPANNNPAYLLSSAAINEGLAIVVDPLNNTSSGALGSYGTLDIVANMQGDGNGTYTPDITLGGIGGVYGAATVTIRVGDNSSNRGNVHIGRDGDIVSTDLSAILQVDSTQAGFLPPRMSTTQKNAISSPATGLIVYDTTLGNLQEYNGSTWVGIGLSSSNFVTREVPSGSINGSNTTFTLAHTPVVGTESVFLNGLLQNAGVSNDYTISGATITFNVAPVTNSVLLVNYIK